MENPTVGVDTAFLHESSTSNCGTLYSSILCLDSDTIACLAWDSCTAAYFAAGMAEAW